MRVLFAALLPLVVSLAALSADWPQFQFDAASQGRAPQAVEPPFQLRWVWYGPENVVRVGRPVTDADMPRPPHAGVGHLSFTMHPVVADGRVIFGDLHGTLYCLNSRTGATIWLRRFPGAFVGAAAIHQPSDDASQNVVIAPCQDGRIYGLSWDGKNLWHIAADRPFVAPAKLDGGTVYAGSLDGKLYAADARTGELRWKYDAGGPIRQPAAIDGGRVFVGSETMIFHAIDAKTGGAIWRTKPGQMTGQSFRNTWPVVVGDKVMTFQILIDGQSEFVLEALLMNATPGGHQQKQLVDWPAERDAIRGWLAGDLRWAVDCNKYWQKEPGKPHEGSRGPTWAGGPSRKTMFVFHAADDGSGGAVEPFQVPMGIVAGTGNSNMGPVLDAAGRPLTWWRVSARSTIPGESFGTAFSPDLSGLDLATGDRIILPTTRNIHAGGPGMELDNHHMLTAAGDYLYYFNPFRQARWVKLDGKQNPTGTISAVYRQHDGGGWNGDVAYYKDAAAAGERGQHLFDSHGAPRTPLVIADDALFANEIDLRAVACYETRGAKSEPAADPPPTVIDEEGGGLKLRLGTGQRVHGQLAWQNIEHKLVVTGIDAKADALRRRLSEHVAAMLEAGPLLPYYARRGETTTRWYFTNPGDTLWALMRAWPHLPAELRPKVKAYVQRYVTAELLLSDRVLRPTDEGRSRMAFTVPPHLVRFDEKLYRQLPRVHNLYALWLYADATGDLPRAKELWPASRAFYKEQRKDLTAYCGGPAGAIGYGRLAKLLGDEAAAKGAEQDVVDSLTALAKEATWREPMARRYGFDTKWAESFMFQGFHLLPLAPEVAAELYQERRDEMLTYLNGAVDHWPMWFLSQGSGFTRYFGESHALPPDFSAMIFPGLAQLDNLLTPDELARWVDAEDAPLGDLFYLERLTLAIEAHGRREWMSIDSR